MVVVIKLERDDRSIRSLQPTELTASYRVTEHEGRRLLQLDTYGSQDRREPGKQSQTLQFTEQSAHQLYRILKEEFGFGD